METHYTPTIEEFHVGFEYEFRSLKGWEARTFNSNDGGYFNNVSEIKEYISEGIIRVKHLDREDIESFGFESRDLKHWEDEEEDVIYKKGNYTLVFWENAYKSDYRTNVYIRQERGLGQHSFKGEVKNKSELKKLLKQLNIL